MNIQTDLINEINHNKKNKIGQSDVAYIQARSILTPTSGFLESYDYSLNPYSGCSFGCTYCYAAFFAKEKHFRDNWGYWVQVKDNALTLLKKRRVRPLINKTLYISSVTDPYQPIEKELQLTRAILQELVDYHQASIYIQTRSPLVTRDIDILGKFASVQVNMTVTTDSETVRRVFEPYCPSNKARIKAITKVHEAGIPSCITMTPLLPVENAHVFAQMLLKTGVENYIIQPFHPQKGRFVAGTRENALKVIKEMDWTMERYVQTFQIIKTYIPNIGEGKAGFEAQG